jgi:hypothetical protein
VPYYSKYKDRHAPKDKSGYLYYVRIKTDLGPLYKVGYTKLASVEDRLSFNGAGDEKLIEHVLLFIYLKDAYSIEQRLHSYFSSSRAFGRYAKYEHMPLFQNGQSELYIKDILNLDVEHCEKVATETHRRIKEAHARQKHKSPLLVYLDAHGIELFARGLGTVIFWTIYPAIWLYDRFNKKQDDTSSESYAKAKQSMDELLRFLAIENERQRMPRQSV